MSGDCCGPPLAASNTSERRALAWVLGINLAQAAVGATVGIAADSISLIGAALDNLADSGIYALSLYAVGRSVLAKARVAGVAGVFLIVFGLVLLAEVIRRFVAGAEPIGSVMIAMAAVNAVTNLICLRLLRSHRQDGVHLKASWIFTSNDMLANVGIALSGIAVWVFNSRLPDLLIGLVVVAIGIKGGWEILEQARTERGGRDSD